MLPKWLQRLLRLPKSAETPTSVYRAGPSSRSVKVEPASPGDPAASLLLFYGGVVEIGVDAEGRLVGCAVRGDLYPDEPLYLPNRVQQFSFRKELQDRPIHLLLDEAGRLVGIHVVGTHLGTRVCDLHPSFATAEERMALDARRLVVPTGRWPTSMEEFNLLMAYVDAEVQKLNLPVHARPMKALELASSTLGKGLRLPPVVRPAMEDAFEDDDFAFRLIEWFRARYGKRLHVSVSPGRFAVELRASIWECKLPRTWGRVEFFCSRAEGSVLRPTNRDQFPRYNVLDAVQGLTDQLRFQLTDEELRTIGVRFRVALKACTALEELMDDPLGSAARSDMEMCVANLVGHSPHYGQAQWSAQQASEKTLKLALKVVGVSYPKTHTLEELSKLVSDNGYTVVDTQWICAVECNPGARYGESKSSCSQAIAAHHAALSICALVAGEARERHGKTPNRSVAGS